MAGFYGQGAGDKLMVGSLIYGFFPVLALIEADAGGHEGQGQDHIDLVDGEPVFDLGTEAFKQDGGVTDEMIDHLAALPGAYGFHQMHGRVEMDDGDQGLDPVFFQLIEYAVIEGQSFFIGLFIIAVGEDPGPVDAHTEAFESHFRHQGNVLFVMMIEINTELGGIIVVRVRLIYMQIPFDRGESVFTVGNHVIGGKAFAAFIPAAFTLVRGGRAAP